MRSTRTGPNSGADSTSRRRLALVAVIAASGFAVGVLLSLRLWYASDRLYPRAPLFGALKVPDALELALLCSLLLSLLVVVIHRHLPSLWMRAAVISAAVLVVFDQSRLQPWVYEYALLLIVLGLSDGTTERGRAASLTACRSIVVALYFWSAVQKMNATFLTRTWPDFVGHVPSRLTPLLTQLGWIVPLAELAAAIGLSVRRFRRFAVIGVAAMHLFIVIALIASGENRVVWPWNVAMAGLVVVLFGRTEAREAAARSRSVLVYVVTLIVWILPALSFLGLWDAYLSAALYSGNTIEAVVVVPPETVNALPPIIRNNTWQKSLPMFVDLNRWSYDELNVPGYPAERVMKAIGTSVCRTYVPASEAMVVILGRPDWRSGARTRTSYSCSSLLR